MKDISKYFFISVDPDMYGTSTITIYNAFTTRKVISINSALINFYASETIDYEEILNRVLEKKYPEIELLIEKYNRVINVEDFTFLKHLYTVMIDHKRDNSYLVFAEDRNMALATVINYLFEIRHSDIQYIFTADELKNENINEYFSIDISAYITTNRELFYLLPEYTSIFSVL